MAEGNKNCRQKFCACVASIRGKAVKEESRSEMRKKEKKKWKFENKSEFFLFVPSPHPPLGRRLHKPLRQDR